LSLDCEKGELCLLKSRDYSMKIRWKYNNLLFTVVCFEHNSFKDDLII